MSEYLRVAAIATATAVGLLLTAIGLAAGVEAQEDDWGLLLAGLLILLGTAVPLLVSRQRRRRRRAGRPGREPAVRR